MKLSVVVLGVAMCFATAASATRTLIVFFAAGDTSRLEPVQWRLSSEANAVLVETYAEYLAYEAPNVLIFAHDEKTGDFQMSVQRSQLRADAVRAKLIELGIPAEKFLTLACGYADASVQVGGPAMARQVTIGFFEEREELRLLYGTACPDVVTEVPSP